MATVDNTGVTPKSLTEYQTDLRLAFKAAFGESIDVDAKSPQGQFIDNLALSMSQNDDAIVKTIIEFGHNLGRRVVAEGVENQRTLDALRLLNVDVIQGFFYNKPQSADDFIAWLIDYNEKAKTGQRELI